MVKSFLINGISNIKELFSLSFFDLGFTIGTAFMVAMLTMIIVQLAPHLGKKIKGNNTASWIIGFIGIIVMLIIFLL